MTASELTEHRTAMFALERRALQLHAPAQDGEVAIAAHVRRRFDGRMTREELRDHPGLWDDLAHRVAPRPTKTAPDRGPTASPPQR